MNFFSNLENYKYKFKDNRKYNKFKNCSLPYPFYDEKHHTFEWILYDKNTKQFNVETNLLYALENNVIYEMSYHYRAKLLGREKPEQELK